MRVVKGGSIDHVSWKIMAVSHFKDNKFGISQEKKNVFIRSVFLTLVKNYSQRTAFFDVLTILPLLVLGAVKKEKNLATFPGVDLG